MNPALVNPGLVVKLRPAGPWRIGPDSGARNRVDAIYHSDSLYSAVTSAMSRLGSLEEWLDATARSRTPAVCFSSCFPFLEDVNFVVPPRTIWPPTSPAAMSARVRWKSARFIPLRLVESMLEGKRLNDNQWSVDGASGCLVPAGKAGPFRTSVRWNAAVDRLSGTSERYSTACIEFREGCGLWTVAAFRDDMARDEWQEKVKAAFRLLADSGFGGERSRGWGRAETPEFVEGALPGLIIEYRPRALSSPELPLEAEEAQGPVPAPPIEEPPGEEPPITEPPPGEEPGPAPVPPVEGVAEAAPGLVQMESVLQLNRQELKEMVAEESVQKDPVLEEEPEPASPAAGPAVPEVAAAAEPPTAAEDAASEVVAAAETSVALESETIPPLVAEPPAPQAVTSAEPPAPVEAASPVAAESPAHEIEPALSDAPVSAVVRAPERAEAMRVTPEREAAAIAPVPAVPLQAHWLLSLFTPAAADVVDWGRGSYAVLARGGRIESPSRGSGDLKKQIQMVAEGSVLYADGVPLGAAADVAPDGFAHPVFRAGFALAIPLPEVH